MKVLLVDDDVWIRDSLSLFFEAEGCNLLTFKTAEEGMEAVKQQAYDIVISDYKLPGMDGLTFLKQIQASHPDAKKILITAYKTQAVVNEAKKVGVQHLIPKPITSDILEASLTHLTANY